MGHIPLENRDSDLLSLAKGRLKAARQLPTATQKAKNNKAELFVAQPGAVTKGSTHRLGRCRLKIASRQVLQHWDRLLGNDK